MIKRLFPDEKRIVDLVTNYIHSHVNEPLDFKELSKLAGRNSDSLGRLFKRQYQSSITDYYRNIRMNEARELILKGVPIKDIIRKMQFTDSSHFSKVFKKAFGMLPKELLSNTYKEN